MKLPDWFNQNQQRIKRVLDHQRSRSLAARMSAEVTVRANPVPHEAPVIFFNASTRLGALSLNAAFALLSGWSLRLTGVQVIHFVCQAGMSRCVLGTNPNRPGRKPPCRICTRFSRAITQKANTTWFTYHPDAALVSRLTGMAVPELSEIVHQGVPLGELTLPSMRWILRRHHLPDDAATRALFREYLLSAWNIFREFSALLDGNPAPRAVVVFNGMFFPEATARWAALQRGLRVITHEVGLQPFSGFFTSGEATAYPIAMPESFELTTEQNQRLDAYLRKRFHGDFSMAGVRFWPEIKRLDPSFLSRIESFKQVVPVFTNVVFDTSQGHANVIFPHMFAWLDLVLEIIRRHPETFFVIRAHPDELRPGKESRESVEDWIDRSRVREMGNVLFVGSREYFSSYEIIQRSKFVMVYNSTIGLEASIMGAPVLCAGKARYTQLPTVFFPPTVDEFRCLAEKFLGEDIIPVPSEHSRNARRFLYYQLFRTSLPFGRFLEEDGHYKGYVVLKPRSWEDYLPENSSSLKTIVDGLLHQGNFYLEE